MIRFLKDIKPFVSLILNNIKKVSMLPSKYEKSNQYYPLVIKFKGNIENIWMSKIDNF